MLIGEHLGFNVAGVIEVALDETFAPAECGDGLAHCGVIQFGYLFQGARYFEPAPTSTKRRLDRDREPVGLCKFDDLVGRRDGIGRSFDLRCTGALGDVPCADLVAE